MQNFQTIFFPPWVNLTDFERHPAINLVPLDTIHVQSWDFAKINNFDFQGSDTSSVWSLLSDIHDSKVVIPSTLCAQNKVTALDIYYHNKQ